MFWWFAGLPVTGFTGYDTTEQSDTGWSDTGYTIYDTERSERYGDLVYLTHAVGREGLRKEKLLENPREIFGPGDLVEWT